MGTSGHNDSPTHRALLVCGVLALLLICAFIAGPWLHLLTDHPYADNRRLLGILNFENVVSNLAFLIVGVLGRKLCAGTQRPRPALSWTVFYLGLVLTCLGSTWHHLNPSDARIVCSG